MPTVQVPAQLTVEHLMAAIRQLSPDEWRDFKQQLDAWQAQNGSNTPLGASTAPRGGPYPSGRREETDEELLATIAENSCLPPAEQRRFSRLRRKRQSGELTEAEEQELQALWRWVEQMNVTRLEALTRLAQRRNTDVRALMRELDLSEERGVC